MSADFLPLAVGNRWVYDVTNEDGVKIGELDVAVQDYTIVDGRSFYVFSAFPFVASDEERIRMIRYDRQEREFLRIARDEEGSLFLGDGSSTEVLQADASGLPQKFLLNTDSMALTFQRGVGIVEARQDTPDGVRVAKIRSVSLGEGGATVGIASPEAATAVNVAPVEERRPRDLVENVTNITEENPRLEVSVSPAPEGTRMAFTVTNISEKLLPFRFKSGQSFDLVVTDPATGTEVWRWSRRQFFSQVLRTEAIRANGKWEFDAVWNHRDNNLDPVAPGRYALKAVLTADPLLESELITLEVR